jgi:hypothetical protein
MPVRDMKKKLNEIFHCRIGWLQVSNASNSKGPGIAQGPSVVQRPVMESQERHTSSVLTNRNAGLSAFVPSIVSIPDERL